MTKGDEYVTNALESDASPRVQKCLDRAEYCERAASILTSPNAIATFLRSARSWREMAEQYRLMATVGRIHQLCRGTGYGDRDETGDEEFKIGEAWKQARLAAERWHETRW